MRYDPKWPLDKENDDKINHEILSGSLFSDKPYILYL